MSEPNTNALPVVEDAIHDAVLVERKKWDYRFGVERQRREYQEGVLAKIWGMVRPSEESDYDTNNFYDYVREGVEAKKRLAEGDRAIKEFIAGQTEKAFRDFDNADGAVGTAVLAERARCSGVAREAIREAAKMGVHATPDWYQSLLTHILRGMNPEEDKISLSREQEMKDAIAEAEMNQREADAKIVETAFDHMSPLALYERYNADGKYVTRLNPEKSGRAIAEKIRSGK